MDQNSEIAAEHAKPVPGLPGIWGAIGWVALFLALQIIFSVAALATAIALQASGGQPIPEMLGDVKVIALPTIWALVLSSLAMLGLLWLYLRRHDRLGLIGARRWSRYGVRKTVALAIAVVSAGLLFNFLYVTYVIPGVEMQDQMKKLFAAIPQTLPNNILLFFAVAIIAPLVEELLFRGLLQNSLGKRMPPWAAILLAAAIFAAVHMQLTAFPALMVLGAAFGYLYHATGSLRVNIIVHMINNSAALLLS